MIKIENINNNISIKPFSFAALKNAVPSFVEATIIYYDKSQVTMKLNGRKTSFNT